jgi:uncharacterized repeat protein (TIGR03847 family)
LSESFEFDEVGLFTAGTLGPRGQRVFLLEIAARAGFYWFKVEKQQVSAIAEYLDQLIEDLPTIEGPPTELEGMFDDPTGVEWTIGSIAAAYESETDRIVLLCEELIEDDSDDEDQTATLRVRLDRHQVLGFVNHARELVASGRPPCQFCGRSLEGDGSFCPCSN